MTEPLISNFGYLCNKEAAEKVMNGDYKIPPRTCPYATELIEELKRPTEISCCKEIDLTVTTEEHQQAWRKMKDKTGSAMQTIGFNHYRSAAYDNTLSKLDAFNSSVPTEIRFTPKRWSFATDVNIPKKIDNSKVDGTRTIQLLPADANMVNKRLGRRILANVESTDTLMKDQYGRRKKHKAINACLNKVILMDTLQIQQEQEP